MIKKLGDFIDNPSFASTEDLLRKSQHLVDGAGLLHCEGSSPYKVLQQLPPHAEYDFDVRHFQANLSPSQVTDVTSDLIKRGQFASFAFLDSNLDWLSEEGFLRSTEKSILLNLTSDLCENAVSFQKRHGERAEIVHVGIQFHCTDRDRLDQILRHRGQVLSLKKIQQKQFLPSLESTINFGFQRPTWVRLNLNSLAAFQGGPESWATGLEVRELLAAFEWLMRQTKFEGISIGPIPHESSMAARTSAQLLSTLLFAYSHRRIVSLAHGKKTIEIFS